MRCAFSPVKTAIPFDFFYELFVPHSVVYYILYAFSQIQELFVRTSSKMTQSQVFLFVLLVSPLLAVGQFVLPFLYMPLKSLFPTRLGSDSKHFKVTSEHVSIANGLTVQQTYGKTTNYLQLRALLLVGDINFFASNLTDLDYYWSYTIPFNEADPSLSNVQFVSGKTAGYVQEHLLKIVSQKFYFQLNTVASALSIQEVDLWTSYNPANWQILVHAMISESTVSFTKLLDLPSVSSLADLVGTSPAELRNANLSRFEALVFSFLSKKAILDAKTTMFLINSSGITPGKSYMDIAISDILEKHENITLTLGQFGILYNLTNEQSKACLRATFNQIFHLCGVSFESIKNLTLRLSSVAGHCNGGTFHLQVKGAHKQSNPSI